MDETFFKNNCYSIGWVIVKPSSSKQINIQPPNAQDSRQSITGVEFTFNIISVISKDMTN